MMTSIIVRCKVHFRVQIDGLYPMLILVVKRPNDGCEERNMFVIVNVFLTLKFTKSFAETPPTAGS